MKYCWWHLFRFLFGSDNRVAIWLCVVGGLWLALRAFTIVAFLSAAGSTQCPDGTFGPLCTESVFGQIVVPILWDLLIHPSFLFLLLGMVGIVMRPRLLLNEASADLAGPVKPEIIPWTPFKRLYGADSRLAIWFIIFGTPWLIGVLEEVIQACALNLPPYTQMWIGPQPQIDSLFEDVVMPVISNNFWNPGAWFVLAGFFGVLAWWICYLWQRWISTPSLKKPGM